MPWSKATHMLGKEVRWPDLGIIALRNKEDVIVAGSGRDQVVQDYMTEMWGTKIEEATSTLNPQMLHKRVSREACDSMLNGQITVCEV